jgi:nucleoside-diphosphate-sugar epimerase
VFLSSAKVGGETTWPGRPLKEDDTPVPLQPYGKSKLEAERGLEKIAEATDMTVTILRPPLVYGAGVHGNFLTLAKAVSKRLPVPLGQAMNLRSLIGAHNLADAVALALVHPHAANQRFYVADSPDLSTSELFTRLGRALGSAPRLFSVPPPLLKMLAGLVGKDGIYERLFASFQVDSSLIRKQLGWKPPYSIDQELSEFASHFESSKQSIHQA